MYDLTPLRRLEVPVSTAWMVSTHLLQPGETLIAGALGSLHFTVVQDDDVCTVVLLAPHGRPTKAQIAAFFRAWGVPVTAEAPCKFRSRGLLFIDRRPDRMN